MQHNNPSSKKQPNPFLVAMADAFAAVEKHDARVTYIYMNPDDFEQGRASLTEELDLKQLSSNQVLWCAQVITMATFPRGWGLLGCSPPVELTPEELMAVHRDAVFVLPGLPKTSV